jgi:hypothetical protein
LCRVSACVHQNRRTLEFWMHNAAHNTGTCNSVACVRAELAEQRGRCLSLTDERLGELASSLSVLSLELGRWASHEECLSCVASLVGTAILCSLPGLRYMRVCALLRLFFKDNTTPSAVRTHRRAHGTQTPRYARCAHPPPGTE